MSLSRQQWTLLGIFAIFFGPLLLVMLMQSKWWHYQPEGRQNRGHLIQPPVHVDFPVIWGDSRLPAGTIENKWLLVYTLPSPCEQHCISNITALRQIHRASGRHAEQLAIVIIKGNRIGPVLANRLKTINPDSVLLDNAPRLMTELTAIGRALAPNDATRAITRTYLLDPMHNVILAYDADADPNDMHKDLKRLLTWSQQENR